tara:strand:+ start:2498 stop:2770 length:273 start_codon:yes stop_codon:yes gene_type:complete
MYNRIKQIIFLLILLIFTFLIIKYYLSEQNQILINKSRSSLSILSEDKKNNLPLIANDTEGVINYVDDIESYKNKRKKRFWEKLISNNDE